MLPRPAAHVADDRLSLDDLVVKEHDVRTKMESGNSEKISQHHSSFPHAKQLAGSTEPSNEAYQPCFSVGNHSSAPSTYSIGNTSTLICAVGSSMMSRAMV